MSGIKSKVDAKKEALQLSIEKKEALEENRQDVLQGIKDFMVSKYGEDSFVFGHPWINAGINSLEGVTIDVDQVIIDAAAWTAETEEEIVDV